MTSLTTFREAMKLAMKAKDSLRLTTIRGVIKELQDFELNKQVQANENDCIVIIEKIIKQTHEAIADFQAADRTESVAEETARIKILEEFLPKAPSQADLIQIVEIELAKHSTLTIKDLGKIMGALKPQLPARSDLKFVTEYIKSKLN